jgi:colanic acid/amylovoran biosynthesis glycosyltransferase
MATGTTLLIYAPVPLFDCPDGLWLEDQACNGLRLWAENFSRVIAMHPVEYGKPPPSWIPARSSAIDFQRVELVGLPTAYRPDQFMRHYASVRGQIGELIDRADYLSFSIGGLFGDWGSVASFEAHRKQRPFAVWTDRVESEVVRRNARSALSLKARLRAMLTHRPMAMLERAVIRRSSLGLFHGAETHATYAPHARVSEVVHDIHLRAEDRISAERLAAKVAAAAEGPLRITYLGRADPMKGPEDWIEAMARLHAAGVSFHATWLGDGERLTEMQDRVKRLGLEQNISLPGFLRNREAILEALRQSQVFVFCHKTPESPRNLIESLVCGTPIVGYDSAFPRDLITGHGGGILTPPDDVEALSSALIELSRDREQLASLFQRAARDGEPFNDKAVFKHRSDIIKQHLSPARDRLESSAPHGNK